MPCIKASNSRIASAMIGIVTSDEPNLVTSMGDFNGRPAVAHADPFVKYYRYAPMCLRFSTNNVSFPGVWQHSQTPPTALSLLEHVNVHSTWLFITPVSLIGICSRTSVLGHQYIVWKAIDGSVEEGEEVYEMLDKMTAPYRS